MPNDDVINALLDQGASASEVSDQIKDLLFAKSASRVDGMKPNVANSMFGDQEVEPKTDTEPKNEVDQEEESNDQNFSNRQSGRMWY